MPFLEPEQLYVAAFGLLWIVVALHFARLRVPYLRLMRANDRLPTTRRWNGMRITMLHLVLSAAYLAANIAFLMVGVNNNQARARRAAIAASTNLVLVAAGGRTNVLADSVGVPYQPYYFAHHWLGRLAIAEATVHGVLNRDGKRTKQWVFGLVALIFLGFIGLSSVSPVRKKFQLAFVKTHLFLALASLAVLPHLWLLPLRRSLEGKIPLSCSAAVWAVVSILRWRRRIKTRARPEGISDYDRALVAAVETNGKAKAEALRQTGATFVKVELPKNVRTYPGAYFYVFFSKLPFWRRYRAIPLMAFSWEPLLPDKLQRYPQHAPEGPADPHVIQDKRQKADHPPNGDGGYASKLTFLILNKPSLSQLLTEDSPIVLDGPYGPNLKLDRFDTVVLAAKGIGIAGALPFLLYLAYRKHHDHARKRPMKERLREEMVRQSETEEGVRYEKTYKQFAPLKLDRTRRITLLWVLESSSQINWASQQFRALAGFDTRREFLHVWIYEPIKCDIKANVRLELGEEFGSHWRIHFVPECNQQSVLQGQIGWEIGTSAGDCVVATCGDQAFTKAVRDFVAKHPRDTTFYELEYQPGRADTSVSENGFRNPRRYLSRLPKPNPVANHGLRRRNDHLESYWNEDSSHVAHPTQVTLRDARRRVNVIHQGRA